MDIIKNRHGYYIEAGSLDPNKEYSEYKKDAEMLYRNFNEKSYLVPNSLTFVLKYNDLEVDGCHIWLSDGLEELADKLQEWARLAPYYTYNMDDDQKYAFIDNAIEYYVYTRDYEWLDEIFKEAMEDHDCETMDELYDVFSFYSDYNLGEITSYLWEIFHDCETMQEIDYTLESVLGYYGDAMIAKIPGDGYYLFFN